MSPTTGDPFYNEGHAGPHPGKLAPLDVVMTGPLRVEADRARSWTAVTFRLTNGGPPQRILAASESRTKAFVQAAAPNAQGYLWLSPDPSALTLNDPGAISSATFYGAGFMVPNLNGAQLIEATADVWATWIDPNNTVNGVYLCSVLSEYLDG